MPEQVEDRESDVQSDGLYLKVSESLAELMDKAPHDNTSQLLTSTLLSLIIRQNLGSSIEEIKECLDQAEKKRFVLEQEGKQGEEIKLLDTTIETLTKFLQKAQKERNYMENIELNIERNSDSIKDLDFVNTINSSKIKDLEQKILTIKNTNHDVIDIPTEEIDINDIPKGSLIIALVKTLAFLVAALLVVLAFGLSCNIFGNIGET
jgi:hypothetical protein